MNESFKLLWSGTCGYSRSRSTSSIRAVAYKLYDSDGYIIDSGTFQTEAMVFGDKFRNTEETIGRYKITKKGDYKLQIMDVR